MLLSLILIYSPYLTESGASGRFYLQNKIKWVPGVVDGYFVGNLKAPT